MKARYEKWRRIFSSASVIFRKIRLLLSDGPFSCVYLEHGRGCIHPSLANSPKAKVKCEKKSRAITQVRIHKRVVSGINGAPNLRPKQII